ncbi:hypothetical protein ACN24M_20475 [Streptomyces microflavus]|uniref:hypothetical protein n=1 Tax=Streptomyces microflavus TaxID=1919 RepID=UPI003B217F09
MQSTAQKVIAYYTELKRSDLPIEVVQDIVKDAAQTLVMNGGLPELVVKASTREHIVICAGSTAQAKRWAEANGFSQRNTTVAHDVSLLHGMHGVAVVTLPGFHGRSDAQQITEAVIAMQGTHEDIIGTTPSP